MAAKIHWFEAAPNFSASKFRSILLILVRMNYWFNPG